MVVAASGSSLPLTPGTHLIPVAQAAAELLVANKAIAIKVNVMKNGVNVNLEHTLRSSSNLSACVRVAVPQMTFCWETSTSNWCLRSCMNSPLAPGMTAPLSAPVL